MTLFLPSEHVGLHWLEQPSAPRRKWQELLPWLLEERLLSPADELLYLPLTEHGSRVLVLVVARAKLLAALDTRSEHVPAKLSGTQGGKPGVGKGAKRTQSGLESKALLPDYFALPWQDNDISIAERGDGYWVVRHGMWEGFAAPKGLAHGLVQQLLEQQPQTGLRLWVADADLPAALRERVTTMEGLLDWHDPPPVAPVLAAKANLRVGEFAPPQTSQLVPWWPSAALLLVAVLLTRMALGFDVNRLGEEVAMLENRRTLTMASLFPELNVAASSAGSDLRAAVDQHINWRFLQRQQLDGPVAMMLQKLDYLLQDCACELSALEIQARGGSLLLSADSSIEPFRLAAMEISTSSAGIRIGFTPEMLAAPAAGATP